jgi:septum formation protein
MIRRCLLASSRRLRPAASAKHRIIRKFNVFVKKMSEKTTRKVQRRLVLASTSRYRRQLLARLGVPFDVVAPEVDETPLPRERPAAAALRLAEAKARAVAARMPNTLVIGSDQVADMDGTHVGKPGDRERAAQQLRALSGRTIVFHTGVALCDANSGRCHSVMVDVASTFRVLTEAEIDDYLVREQPYDCAGGVKSEGLGIALFQRIASDDPTALIGLPLIAVVELLRAEGESVFDMASSATPAKT